MGSPGHSFTLSTLRMVLWQVLLERIRILVLEAKTKGLEVRIHCRLRMPFGINGGSHFSGKVGTDSTKLKFPSGTKGPKEDVVNVTRKTRSFLQATYLTLARLDCASRTVRILVGIPSQSGIFT